MCIYVGIRVCLFACIYIYIYKEIGPDSIRKMYTQKSLLMYTCFIHINICLCVYALIERGREKNNIKTSGL